MGGNLLHSRHAIAGFVGATLVIVTAAICQHVRSGSDHGVMAESTLAPTDRRQFRGSGSIQRGRIDDTGPIILNPRHSRSGFTHPGVLVSAKHLEFVREQVNVGKWPWTTGLDAMMRSEYASLTWRPKPRTIVDCGPYSKPDHGCKDEESDGVAAYTHALLWYFTLDRAHAKKAIEIIDAWSGTLRKHTNRNAPLQAAWSAASFVRAAEIMRHTYKGWSSGRAGRAESMFRNAFLPLLMDGAGNAGGNWELIMLDAAIGIAVFLDDRALFDRAIAKWRKRVQAYIYITEDGAYPKGPPGGPYSRDGVVSFWFGQSKFVNGLSQETCRDFGHTAWGLSALAHVAETAWIQGVDLYAEVRKRLTSALELHASYELGKTVPDWLCKGTVQKGFRPSPEVAYNHYAGRLVLSLPNTKKLVESLRPSSAGFFYGWETLTHTGIAR